MQKMKKAILYTQTKMENNEITRVYTNSNKMLSYIDSHNDIERVIILGNEIPNHILTSLLQKNLDVAFTDEVNINKIVKIIS